MGGNRRITLPIWATMGGVVLFSCSGMMSEQPSPPLPPGWPEALRVCLKEATLCGLMVPTNYEDVYEIPFFDRETFEKTWPDILQLKTRGAPLTLYRSSDSKQPAFRKYRNVSGVRIRTAPNSSMEHPWPVTIKSGKTLQPGPPWPNSALDSNGVVAEYVTPTDDGWIAVGSKDRGFRGRHRARNDIELVVDGRVIDLNRIPLPSDTPIIDRRMLGSTTRPSSQPTSAKP